MFLLAQVTSRFCDDDPPPPPPPPPQDDPVSPNTPANEVWQSARCRADRDDQPVSWGVTSTHANSHADLICVFLTAFGEDCWHCNCQRCCEDLFGHQASTYNWGDCSYTCDEAYHGIGPGWDDLGVDIDPSRIQDDCDGDGMDDPWGPYGGNVDW